MESKHANPLSVVVIEMQQYLKDLPKTADEWAEAVEAWKYMLEIIM